MGPSSFALVRACSARRIDKRLLSEVVAVAEAAPVHGYIIKTGCHSMMPPFRNSADDHSVPEYPNGNNLF